MKLSVTRLYKKTGYTIGKLYVDGTYFCDTLEDKDRGLKQGMTCADLRRLKLNGRTAIPTGRYEVSLKVRSVKFGAHEFYKRVCDGKLPRLLDVPCFEGVLLHCGNTADDTEGCILVGRNTVVGGLTMSRDTFEALMTKMKAADKAGESITITIV